MYIPFNEGFFFSSLYVCHKTTIDSFEFNQDISFNFIKFDGVREIPALVRLNKRTVSFSFQQFFISFSIIYCLHFTVSNNSELSYQLIHELRFYKFIFSNTMVDYFDTYVNQITL